MAGDANKPIRRRPFGPKKLIPNYISFRKHLPTFTYSSSDSDTHPIGGSCSVCYKEFVDGDKECILPECMHGMHYDCALYWSKEDPYHKCPTCGIRFERPLSQHHLEVIRLMKETTIRNFPEVQFPPF